MTDDVAMTTLPATPVRYRFVSVHRIVGFSELRTIPELLTALELPLDLHMTGVSASLTVDPNQALTEIDRGAALGHLMLLGFSSGQRAPGDLLTAIHEKASGYAQERLKKFGAPGVYLVLEARGDGISTQAEVARDLGGAMFAFDAVDKKALIAPYAPLVSAAVAAVALCVDTTSDVTNVADGVELTLPGDRPLYSLTFTGGTATVIASRPATDTDARAIEESLAALMRDERLHSPARLLVDALRSTNDRLEAFIFAWAALEMVIRKYTVGSESGKWVKTVRPADREFASILHKQFVDGGHQYYSLAAKTRVFALTHRLGSGEDLAAEVARIRRVYREPLYHEGAITQHLPVEAVVALAKRLIAAATNDVDHLTG